jgi:hypothetical protein
MLLRLLGYGLSACQVAAPTIPGLGTRTGSTRPSVIAAAERWYERAIDFAGDVGEPGLRAGPA